jgi:hypothetical protein
MAVMRNIDKSIRPVGIGPPARATAFDCENPEWLVFAADRNRFGAYGDGSEVHGAIFLVSGGGMWIVFKIENKKAILAGAIGLAAVRMNKTRVAKNEFRSVDAGNWPIYFNNAGVRSNLKKTSSYTLALRSEINI